MEPLAEHDPKQIGDFTIIGRIGEGGMGVVYLASKAGRNAALKVIHPLLMRDPSSKTRFEREIEVLEKIDSPYVAKILGHGIDDGRAWFATEFVNGPDLKTLVEQEGPLRGEAWNSFANQLLQGLSAIHKAGVIHRDIKPSNLVMSDSGLKIIDFGIAHSSDATSITASGFMTGSPAWFSPEQIEGGEITPASDLFSAGSVLVYAASGETPWGPVDGMTKATVFKILAAEPNLASLSTAQADFVSTLLSQAPGTRDPNIGGAKVRDQAHRKPIEPSSRSPRRKWLLPTGLAVAIGLGVTLTAFWLSGNSPEPASNLSSDSQTTAPASSTTSYAPGEAFLQNLSEIQVSMSRVTQQNSLSATDLPGDEYRQIFVTFPGVNTEGVGEVEMILDPGGTNFGSCDPGSKFFTSRDKTSMTLQCKFKELNILDQDRQITFVASSGSQTRTFTTTSNRLQETHRVPAVLVQRGSDDEQWLTDNARAAKIRVSSPTPGVTVFDFEPHPAANAIPSDVEVYWYAEGNVGGFNNFRECDGVDQFELQEGLVAFSNVCENFGVGWATSELSFSFFVKKGDWYRKMNISYSELLRLEFNSVEKMFSLAPAVEARVGWPPFQ